MPRRPPPPKFLILPVAEAVDQSGLPLGALVVQQDVQRLTRIVDGRREDALRVPVELVDGPVAEPDLVPVTSQNGMSNPTRFRPRPKPVLPSLVELLGAEGGLVLRGEIIRRLGVSKSSAELALAEGLTSGVLVRERRGMEVAYGLAKAV